MDITLHRVTDIASLEAPWRALEQRADTGFFRGWTWTGCVAARFSAPVLLRAEEQGRIVALALFNARPAMPGPGRLVPWRLHLGETGSAAPDAVFVEHNGPLLEAGREALLLPLLQAALTLPLPGQSRHGRTLVLSGVGDPVRAAAERLPVVCRVRQARKAPFVPIGALPAGDFLDTLGSSTRYQLRRSARRYAAIGQLALCRAADVAEGLAFLDALVALHEATWTARGAAGAFADPEIPRFHRMLISRGLPRGEVDLLRVTAGARVVGYLYNVLTPPGAPRQWVGNYQCGFDYAVADPHCKPGLTCHHLAIEHYRAQGRQSYDFLAGESRYKTSLASAGAMLHWVEIIQRRSAPGLVASGLGQLRRLKAELRAWRKPDPPPDAGTAMLPP